MREEQAKAVGGSAGATWIDDSEVDSCQLCEKEFNLSRRKVSFNFIYAKTENCLAKGLI